MEVLQALGAKWTDGQEDKSGEGGIYGLHPYLWTRCELGIRANHWPEALHVVENAWLHMLVMCMVRSSLPAAI